MTIYRGVGGSGDSATGEDVFGDNSSITSLNGISGAIQTPTYIKFASNANHTANQGELTWNTAEGTLDLGLNHGGVVLQIGQELHYRVTNQSGSNISDGTLVAFVGTTGNSGKLLVEPYDGTQASKTILGLTTETIINGENGYVTCFGKVRGIQTNGANYGETWADGDILYAGSTGGLTKTLPQAPNSKTAVAVVVNSHVSNGALFVRVQHGSDLNEDELVQLTSLTNGDILQYNSVSGRFENVDASVVAGSISDGDKGDITVSGSGATWIIDNDVIDNANVNTNAAIESSKLQFTAAGSGVVARPVQSKLREFVSVKDFGAVGDGVTDDTAAINSAIDAVGTAGGGIVYIPAGVYAIGKTSAPYNPAISGSFDRDVIIDVQYDNVIIKGDGRGNTILTNTITNTTAARGIKIGRRIDGVNYVDNVSVQDLTLIGNYTSGAPNSTNTSTGIDISGSAGVGCTNIKLERLEIRNCAGYGIGFQRDGFINCIVSDVQIQDTSADGIDFKMDTNNSGYGNLIEKVTVLRFGLGTASAQAGIDARTGVSIRDVYVAEYGGNLSHVGVRINSSIDTTASQQSSINNARCISTGGVGTKGFQFIGFYGRYSNLYATGAEINYWVRSSKSQYTNLVSVGATQGIYIYADASNEINNNLFTNAYVTGATTGVILAGSGTDLVENTFVNLVAESNTTNVLIGAGVLRTTFIGGTVTGVSDSGTDTQILGTGGTAGPVRLGRSNIQHWLMSGDSSFNILTAVNPAGTPRAALIRADANSGELRLYTLANQDVVFYRNNAVRLRITDLEVRPGNDNLTSSGSAAARWSVVYAGTGAINTSDIREKQQIRDLSTKEKLVAEKLKKQIKSFKFNDSVNSKGDKARIHFGVMAQEVIQAFESEGLNAMEYAIVCYDEWDEVPELIDEDGEIVQEYQAAGNRYGIRYDELLAFIISAM